MKWQYHYVHPGEGIGTTQCHDLTCDICEQCLTQYSAALRLDGTHWHVWVYDWNNVCFYSDTARSKSLAIALIEHVAAQHKTSCQSQELDNSESPRGDLPLWA